MVVDAFFGVTEHFKGVFHGCACFVHHSAKKGWRRDSHSNQDDRGYTTNDQRVLEANRPRWFRRKFWALVFSKDRVATARASHLRFWSSP